MRIQDIAELENSINIDKITAQLALTLNGTYDTVGLLTTAYPSGNGGVYLVRADNNQYSWSGTAWAIYTPTVDAGSF